MKRAIFSLGIYLGAGALCLFFPLESKEKILQALDQAIDLLSQKVEETKVAEANEQVESQKYMIANWPEYADEIEETAVLNRKENRLENSLDQLKEIRKEISNTLQSGDANREFFNNNL